MPFTPKANLYYAINLIIALVATITLAKCTTTLAAPDATQAQQTLEAAIQQQVTAEAEKQHQLSITETIDAAVSATIEAPTSQAATLSQYPKVLKHLTPTRCARFPLSIAMERGTGGEVIHGLFSTAGLAANATAIASLVFPELATSSFGNTIVSIEVISVEMSERTLITKDKDSVWQVTDATYSKQSQTDPFRVWDSVRVITSLVYTEKFEAGDNLSDFGLKPPVYAITIGTTDGKKLILNVGHASPITPRYYTI